MKDCRATAMTIAGSDSSGGAGIQADLKTFHQFGVFGTSVITALTAQNTRGISAIHPVPPEFVAEQYVKVITDVGADAAKTGMLAKREIILALAEVLNDHPPPYLVVDPIILSSKGTPLLESRAVFELVEKILPLATLLTPNLMEAAAILESDPIDTVELMFAAAEKIHALGPDAVLVKGGHLPPEEEAVDVFYDGASTMEFRSPRLKRKHIHGSGCTLSAAITAELAKGKPISEAILAAKNFITKAIRSAPRIGRGVRPLNHFVSTEPGIE